MLFSGTVYTRRSCSESFAWFVTSDSSECPKSSKYLESSNSSDDRIFCGCEDLLQLLKIIMPEVEVGRRSRSHIEKEREQNESRSLENLAIGHHNIVGVAFIQTDL